MKLLDTIVKKASGASDPQALSFAQCQKTNIALCGREFLELDGCMSLLVYLPEKISMRVKEGVLTVEGAQLSLKVYHGNHIAIVGKIRELNFQEEDCIC